MSCLALKVLQFAFVNMSVKAFTRFCWGINKLRFYRLVSTSTLRYGDVKLPKVESIEEKVIKVEGQDEVFHISGVPNEQIATRKVRIFSPAKNAMQSGTFKTNVWQMEFDSRERWENPLMGWTSSGDPLGQMRLTFSTAEDAIAFCEKNGWNYYVEEKQPMKIRPKSYGDNFSWNKRARVSTK